MTRHSLLLPAALILLTLMLVACGGAAAPTATAEATTTPEIAPTAPPEYEIVTLLPRDAIPAIFEPAFLSAAEADAEYSDDELVIGVEIDGDARAYSAPFLSSHEIVNDVVGGKPLAVTW